MAKGRLYEVVRALAGSQCRLKRDRLKESSQGCESTTDLASKAAANIRRVPFRTRSSSSDPSFRVAPSSATSVSSGRAFPTDAPTSAYLDDLGPSGRYVRQGSDSRLG